MVWSFRRCGRCGRCRFASFSSAGWARDNFPLVPKLIRSTSRPPSGELATSARATAIKYLFLETLTCARDRIYFSYVARDAQTGLELSPSPLVNELMRHLHRGGEQSPEAESGSKSIRCADSTSRTSRKTASDRKKPGSAAAAPRSFRSTSHRPRAASGRPDRCACRRRGRPGLT